MTFYLTFHSFSIHVDTNTGVDVIDTLIQTPITSLQTFLCALTVDSSITTLSPPTPPTPPYSLEGITPSPRRGSGFEDPTRSLLGKTLRKHENFSHLQLCDLRTPLIRF